MSLQTIAAELFSSKTEKTLFHYSSLAALKGIVDAGGLYASDIHYFNDAAELRHFMHLLHGDIARRLEAGTPDENILVQFRDWTSHRLTDGNMVFVTSFTENGNLLSQWRAYCPVGKGLSLGFSPGLIERSAARQSFQLGKCIYELAEQQRLVGRVLDAIIAAARDRGEQPPKERHPSQSYNGAFEAVENTLLYIGALIKHPSFKEEEEWRAVSPAFTNYVEAPIQYREGASMLVPYIVFSLISGEDRSLRFQHVYVGPTPNINLSMNSISRFLAKRQVGLLRTQYCGIPYRAW